MAVPDIIDAAQAREETDRADALRSALCRRPVTPSKICVECGEEIPLARRVAYETNTCVRCQEDRERASR